MRGAGWATVGASNTAADGEANTHPARDRGDQAHRRQRIPAQVEERVVDPNPVHTQHLGVDAGQDVLDRVGRGAVTIDILVFRCRQGAGVEFAVDRQRQRIQHHQRGRNHVGRQPLGQRAASSAGSAVPVT